MPDIEINPDPVGDHDHPVDAALDDVAAAMEHNADAAQRVEDAERVAAGQMIVADFAGRIPDPEINMRQLPNLGVMAEHVTININQGDASHTASIARLEVRVDQLEKQVKAVQDSPAAGGERVKCLKVAMGVMGLVSEGLLIYYAIKNNLQGDPPEVEATFGEHAQPRALGAGSDPATSPDVVTIAQAWLKPSTNDADFWENLAKFAEAAAPRPFQEQLMFLQYTVDLANAANKTRTPFVWDSPVEKLALVDKLTKIMAATDGGLAAAYRDIPTEAIASNGKQQALPRAVAAEVMSLALVGWWTNFAP